MIRIKRLTDASGKIRGSEARSYLNIAIAISIRTAIPSPRICIHPVRVQYDTVLSFPWPWNIYNSISWVVLRALIYMSSRKRDGRVTGPINSERANKGINRSRILTRFPAGSQLVQPRTSEDEGQDTTGRGRDEKIIDTAWPRVNRILERNAFNQSRWITPVVLSSL